MGTSQSTNPSNPPSENPSQDAQPLSAAVQIFKNYLEDKKLESIYPSPDSEVIKPTSKGPTKPPLHTAQTVTLYARALGPRVEDIGKAHERTQINETTSWPHSVNGVLVSTMDGVRKWGTGIMIGPNVVLTAAHNLYDYRGKIYSELKGLKFFPGINGQVLPFGPVEVDQYFVSPNYIKECKEDYAILILKEPIGERTGYFGLACLEPEEIKAQRLHVTGYPSDRVVSTPNSFELWGMEGTASHVYKEKGTIDYYTVVFQSGSGVWYQEGESYYVCGVHLIRNQATLLTGDMYRQIYQWLQQAKVKECLYKLKEPKTLSFWSSEMTPENVSLLMKYDFNDLKGLTVVPDDHGGFTGVQELAQNRSWSSLSKLSLSGSNIGDEGVKTLAENISWVNLAELDLSGNNISDEGAKALAENTSWKSLLKLNLSGNKIGGEGAKALRENKTWENIEISGIPEENN